VGQHSSEDAVGTLVAVCGGDTEGQQVVGSCIPASGHVVSHILRLGPFPGSSCSSPGDETREPEVTQLYGPRFGVHEKVLGLDVAVNHVVGVAPVDRLAQLEDVDLHQVLW